MKVEKRTALWAEAGLTAVVIAVLTVMALPGLLQGRDRARATTCEAVWLALRPSVTADLDAVLSGGETRCGTSSGNQQVVDCTTVTHRLEENPRNHAQSAYTTAGDVAASGSSCRVGLLTTSTNGIRFNQFVRRDSASNGSRSTN